MRTRISAIVIGGAIMACTACVPAPRNPITWITRIFTSFPAVDNSTKPAELREVSCAVVLRDDQINTANKTTFIPIDGFGLFFPEKWYWECLGKNAVPGSTDRSAVPTFKGSGKQNDASLPLSAQCLVTTWPRTAGQPWECYFPVGPGHPTVQGTAGDKVFMQVATA